LVNPAGDCAELLLEKDMERGVMWSRDVERVTLPQS